MWAFFRKREGASYRWEKTKVSQNFVAQWHAKCINKIEFLALKRPR
jgi:hypothetical protein